MRMKGRFHEVSPGVWSRYPQTQEEALQENIAFYQPLPVTNPCPRPGHERGSILYAKTGIHRCCALRDSIDAYNRAVRKGEPTDPHNARRMGYDHYWQSDPGKTCGHVGMTLLNGKCFECALQRSNQISARQAAIAAGETWYMPEKACGKCGQIALKRVNNGECKGCKEENGIPRIQDIAPDMIIDKKAAADNGFNVYRTGKACRHGHKGWRYISTGTCIDCLKS